MSRAALLAEGLLWHLPVQAKAANPGPTAEGWAQQPGEGAAKSWPTFLSSVPGSERPRGCARREAGLSLWLEVLSKKGPKKPGRKDERCEAW